MTSQEMLNYALEYNQWGWSVVPVEDKGKKPKVSWEKFQKQPATEEEIREWWGVWPNANIGIVTGAVSGLVVVDVDSEKAYESLQPYFDGDTLTCKTGKGWHFYFKHPGGQLSNAVGVLEGVDVRADGGLVVAPPSVHESGRRYKWDNTSEIAELPSELLKLFSGAKSQEQPHKDWEQPIPEGRRDTELTRLVGKLIQQGHPWRAVLAMAEGLNAELCQPPLPVEEVEKIVTSIWKREEGKGKKQEEPFQIIDYSSYMMKYANSEVRWLVEGWVPQSSVGMVVGPPESFKTWLMLDLAISVASGGAFLEQYAIKAPGPVVVFQQEDGHINLARRANLITSNRFPQRYGDRVVGDTFEIEIPPAFPLHIREFGALEFDNPKSIEKLREIVAEIRPALVVLDPLYSATGAKDYMMEAARDMLVFKEIREEFGTSFMIGHHTKKGSHSGEREELWGSQFLNAVVEWQWQMRKDKGEVTLKRYGKTFGKQAKVMLNFDINMKDDWRYNVETTEIAAEEEIARSGKEDFVRNCLRQNMPRREIIEQSKAKFNEGVSPKFISKLKREMEEEDGE